MNTETNSNAGAGCPAATCSACRWWVEGNHTMAPTPQRECRNEKFLHESGWPSAGDAAKSLTYQHYEGGQIWTGPDFGCVHFEPNSTVNEHESLPNYLPNEENPAEAGVDVQLVRRIEVLQLVRRIEVLMREASDLSCEFERIYDKHPSKYLINRAWVAMSDARDKAGVGTM